MILITAQLVRTRARLSTWRDIDLDAVVHARMTYFATRIKAVQLEWYAGIGKYGPWEEQILKEFLSTLNDAERFAREV
jgi:hypothetical protein